MPLHQTHCPCKRQTDDSNPESCLIEFKMPRFYRSPEEPQHWLVWSGELGWYRFPAKMNGWEERRPAGIVLRQKLQRVPLHLAFNTGLLEAMPVRTLRAA
jgi:hypothetical protein